MGGSLISADNIFGLLTVFLGLAAFGFWSENTRLGRLLSGVIMVIVAGLLLSNFRIVPFASPFYDAVWTYAVSLAIPLLLFRANLRKILPELGHLLISFVLAVIGTVAGVIVGFALVPLGANGNEIAATLGASWIGGSMNFAAVSQALGMDDQTQLSAMAAADNVGGTLFLILLVSLPGMMVLRRLIPSPLMDAHALGDAEEEAEEAEGRIRMGGLAIALALSAACCFVGFGIAELIGIGRYGVLFVTLAALAVANLFPGRLAMLHGDFALGMFFMYVFFGVMGAGADIGLMIATALPIFLFTAIMALVHLLVVLTGAKLFRLDLAECLLTSNAVALGPATAAAMAAGQRWRALVTPAVMLGVLGYAIANFIGVGLAGLLG